jgi:hypothetical protein
MVTHIVLRERNKFGSIRRKLWIPVVAGSEGNLARIMLRTNLTAGPV